MRRVPIEHHQVLLEIEFHLLRGGQLRQAVRLVVLRPHRQASSGEFARGRNEAGAKVVLVAVAFRCIVAVQVDAGPGEVLHLRWQDPVQPAVQHLDHRGVALGRARHVDVTNAISQEAQGVRPDPVLSVGHDVQAPKVAPEGPGLEHLQHLLLADGLLGPLCLVQHLLRVAVRQQSMCALPHGFVPRRLHDQFVFLQATAFAQFFPEPAVDLLVHRIHLLRVRHFGYVDGFVADRTT
mmetsp:Transcript_11468/g.19389  ORF Transcript_11468/g.19389 Transcript_11468/m.19389 type:complete len:237 (+) Transcript_11468:355-1065(+)